MNNKFIKNKIKYKKGGKPNATGVTLEEHKKSWSETLSQNMGIKKGLKSALGMNKQLDENTVTILQESIKESIKKSINLFDKVEKIGLNEEMTNEEICSNISNKNILLNFNKEIYKAFNTAFNDISLTVDNERVNIDNKFNILLFNKLVHGKLKAKWPPKEQIDNLRKSLNSSSSSTSNSS
jgi:hypothetical protein